MNTKKFKPGDTLDWLGKISHSSVTDFSGYTLQCQIRKKDKTIGVQPTPDMSEAGLLAEANIVWVDATQGTCRMTVDRAVTSPWPINDVAFADVSIIDDSGYVLTTATDQFELVPRSTVVP